MANLRILLIDDELDFLDVMGNRIRGWGYELIQAANGKEAIDIIKSEKPDIIILDYMMPEMDGVEVLKQIREIDKKLPVIMFTAYPDERSIKGSEELGVNAFIPKFSVYSDPKEALKTAVDMTEKKLKNHR